MTGNVKKGGSVLDSLKKMGNKVGNTLSTTIPMKKVSDLIKTEYVDKPPPSLGFFRVPRYYIGEWGVDRDYHGMYESKKTGEYYLSFNNDKFKIDLKTNDKQQALDTDISEHNIQMTKQSKKKYDEIMSNKASESQQSAGKKRRTKKRKSMKKKQRKTKRRKSLKKRKSIKKRKA